MELYLKPLDKVDWTMLDRFPDRTVFQTKEWLSFLEESQRAIPVLAELRNRQCIVGYFTGLLFSRFGLRILGSPFPGWTTPYMGFNLMPGTDRRDALLALERFAFRDLRCLHLEISDLFSAVEEGESCGYKCSMGETLFTDLTQSEERIFRTMDRSCRSSIRKAERAGVRIEEAEDDTFADEYYDQLRLVFARQHLVPTYGLDRVRQLLRHMLPTGKLLLLRARTSNGACIATSIYVGCGTAAMYWGNASIRDALGCRPNEAMNWYAIRYWKQRGTKGFDWGGAAEHGRYKRKYGGEPLSYARFTKSKFVFVDILRTGARHLVTTKQILRGHLASLHREDGLISPVVPHSTPYISYSSGSTL